jgi:LEA14-like dessication related protein
MRRPAAISAVLAALLSVAASAQTPRSRQLGEDAPPWMGSIEHMQVTSITRKQAAIWLRVLLPRAAEGGSQTFTGEVTVANVPLPVHPPLHVWVQNRPGRIEAVVDFKLRIDELPEELPGKIGTQTLDLVLQGTLAGDKGSSAPVHAVGLLRYGTKDIDAPYGSISDFVRLDSARLTGVTLSETKGEARVVLYDPFSFPIAVKNLTWSLMAGDRKLCGGEREAIRIHPGRENLVTVPIEAKNTDLMAAAGSAALRGGVVEGRLVGALALKVGRGEITLPIDLPGKINVLK